MAGGMIPLFLEGGLAVAAAVVGPGSAMPADVVGELTWVV